MKKKIPLAVLKEIQPILDKYRSFFISLESGGLAVDLIDIEADSDFYFKCSYRDNDGQYLIEMKPQSADSVFPVTVRGNLNTLTVYLEAWLSILKQYSELITIYDDPVVDGFRDEFFQQFGFEGESSENAPYKEEQQLLFRKYLSQIKGLLPAYKEVASEQQAVKLASIEAEINMMSEYIGVLSKTEAIKKLSKIWAMSRKYSMTLIMEMLQEIKKEGFKTIAKTFIEGALMKGLQAWLT